MDLKPFIIFAHARSGSTSLAYCLDSHPDVNVAIEPFHPGFPEWNPGARNYAEFIKDKATLEEAVSEIFSKYNGMKVLDYQHPEDIYTHMLRMTGHRVIFLRRRNLLEAIVSGLIAEQTDVWQVSDLNPDRRKKFSGLSPLSLEEIRMKLDYGKEIRELYRGVCQERDVEDVLFLDYEDLFTPDLSRNRSALEPVFRFLGITVPDLSAVDAFLDPGKARIRSVVGYDALPNADEINKAFGCDETGWLSMAE